MRAETITISQQNDVYFIKKEDIMFCQADNNYTNIHLTHERKIMIVRSLSKFHEELPPEEFIRISQSFVVNKNHIVRIKKKVRYVELYGNKTIPFTISFKKLMLLIGQAISVYTIMEPLCMYAEVI